MRERNADIALAVLALLLALAAPARAGDETGSAVRLQNQAVRVLDRLAREETGPDEAVSELVALGADVAPALVSLRQSYAEPAAIDATVRVLARFDPSLLPEYLLWCAGEAPDPAARVAAYERIPPYLGPDDLPALLAIFAKDPPAAKRAGEVALVDFLRRHPDRRVYLTIRNALPSMTKEESRARTLDCVAEAGSAEGFRLLVAKLGQDPVMDPIIVAGLARMPDVDECVDAVPKLRELTRSPDPFIRRQAVIAMGHFEDPAAVALLIELLGATEAGIRENAGWSLRKIAGEPFPPDARRWQLWYDGEMRWWEERGRRLLDTLESSDQALVLAAILEISEHPFFRNLVHGALERLRAEGNDRVSAAAGDALDRLGLSGKDAPRGRATLATEAFLPPRELPSPLPPGSEEPGVEIEPRSTPSLLLIVAGVVILYLFWRVIGSSLFDAMWSRWGRERNEGEGPITVRPRPRPERFAGSAKRGGADRD